MRLGIKVASNPTDIERLLKTGSRCCEIRFILEQDEQFKPILRYIKQNSIQPNFHFWAAFDNKILANPAAPGELGRQSVQAIRDTIKIAAENKAGYVVLHPGTTMVNQIDHQKQCILPLKTIAEQDEACLLYTSPSPRD